jgi:toxin ParE1/3/4
MRLRLTAEAKSDMRRIWAYYEKRRSGLGDEFLDDLGAAVRQVRELPAAQPVYWNGTRRVLLRRFPYGAAYRVSADDIVVLVIAHTSRSVRVWRGRLGKI